MLYSGRLLQPLLQLVASDPGTTVLHLKNTKLTAAELLQKSLNAASALSDRGFKPNDIAVIAAMPGEEFLEIIYAVLMLKGRIAIIDPEMGRDNYAAKMAQLKPRWIFLDSRILLLHEHPILKALLFSFNKYIPSISFNQDLQIIATGGWMPVLRKHILFKKLSKVNAGSAELKESADDPENVIVYTSGTLHVPKGVLHTDRSLSESLAALGKLFKQDKNAIVGTHLPQFMLLGIATGLAVRYVSPNVSAAQRYTAIEKQNIGILFGPPSDYLPLIQHCEKLNCKLPLCLQHLLLGSAPVRVSFLQRLIKVCSGHTRITCMYGMTENLLVATVDGRIKASYECDGDLLGKPVEGVEVMISETSEIMVRSPQLFSRYYHQQASNTWHATGDLGEYDEKGNLILIGRAKEMIIRRNMNIYPALYEGTITQIPGVDDAALVGIYDNNLQDERVYLAIEGKNANVEKIKKQLSQGKHSIDKEAMPDVIFAMNIPRKGRQNKIDRNAIKEYIKQKGW